MSEPKNFSRYRWTVCALIFFATTINYLDRQVIGILKPLLESDLGIGEIGVAHLPLVERLPPTDTGIGATELRAILVES